MLKNLVVFIIIVGITFFAISYALKIAPNGIGGGDFFKNPLSFYQTDPQSGLILPVYTIPEYKGIELPYQTSENGEVIVPDSRTPAWAIDTNAALEKAESDYNELAAAVREARAFGDPSPDRGTVQIVDMSTDVSASGEYITLENYGDRSVSIEGWSLQSAVSGVRVPLPAATRTFVMGAVPSPTTITLEPYKAIYVNSGPSPVGVSFQENSCSGYLSQFQSFVPHLGNYQCPQNSDELPWTPENVQRYGESCLTYVDSLPSCHFHTDAFPNSLSSSCREYIREALTYNGCVARNKWRPSFHQDVWRVFLEQPEPLWGTNHDIIRLLDAQGRTVDVYNY
jgi:hypothetical protein